MDVGYDPNIDQKIELLANSQNIDMFLSYMKRAMELEVVIPNQQMQRTFIETKRDYIQNLYISAVKLLDSGEDTERALALLKEYRRFREALGPDYCQLPGDQVPSSKTQQIIDEQEANTPPAPPMSDYEALFFSLHYAGATSKRTVGGTIAKAMVETYDTCHQHDQNDITRQMIRIYQNINAQASTREKVVRRKDQTVTMSQARKAHSELKNRPIWTKLFTKKSAFPDQLSDQIPGKDALEESRQAHLTTYKAIVDQQILPHSVDILIDQLDKGFKQYLNDKQLDEHKPEHFDVETKELYDAIENIRTELVEIKLEDAIEADAIKGTQFKQLK